MSDAPEDPAARAARRLRSSTLAAQAVGPRGREARDVVLPIHPSTTYERDPGAAEPGPSYSRDENPAYEAVEGLLAALEGAAGARVFASGMAAATAVFDTLEAGDHLAAPEVMYWALRRRFQELAPRRGIALDLVPNGDLRALQAALRPGRTRLVWVETPANPTWAVTDIAAAAGIAHHAGAALAVDGTVATPVLTRPLRLGADLVVHSASKYLNGHSDVVAGAVAAAREDERWERICRARAPGGAVLGPFEAWLLLRGMRTLFLRVPAACRGAQCIADSLSGHPKLVEVLYPGLPSHPGHKTAAEQMEGGFGGMLSIRVRGGGRAARAVAAAVRVFRPATSLGGTESLIEHRASVEGPDSPVTDDLLRLSVGIEDPEDLLADLLQALERV